MTEASTSSQDSTPTMPPRLELTLIVAATNGMGIGLKGTLPWTGLKKEMAYFARVTKRANPGTQNTVIMGRKTWDSIPERFRPLKDRQNIVITTSHISPEPAKLADHIRSNSLESAIQYLSSSANTHRSGRAFVIGGSQIYKAALEKEEVKRILLTRVETDFECDTWFPVVLKKDEESETGWRPRSKMELDEWVGEHVPEGVQTENGTNYTFEMWERK